MYDRDGKTNLASSMWTDDQLSQIPLDFYALNDAIDQAMDDWTKQDFHGGATTSDANKRLHYLREDIDAERKKGNRVDCVWRLAEHSFWYMKFKQGYHLEQDGKSHDQNDFQWTHNACNNGGDQYYDKPQGELPNCPNDGRTR